MLSANNNRQHAGNLILASGLVLFCACSAGTANSAGSPAPPANQHVHRSLVDEASRAEVRELGLFIDLGTPDQHKYIRGGWKTGWGRTQANHGLASNAAKAASLYVWDWKGGTKSLVMRLRSQSLGQRLGIKINGLSAGNQKVPEDWGIIEFPLEGPLQPGRYLISLNFAKPGPGKLAAQVDWIWLRTEDGNPPCAAKKVVPDFVAPRPSLKADPPRTYSYYLEIPPQAALSFSYAAEQGVMFGVNISLAGQETRRLVHFEARESQWSQAWVDLSEFSGNVVRLDLVTSGSGGKAVWGEPVITVPGPAPQVPAISPENQAKNLIYIVIDTARQDVYRPFNPNTQVMTPAFDELAAESVIFPNAYVNAPWTKPSDATFLSGLYPATHGAKYKRTVLSRKVLLVQEHLQKNGFKTAGFIANGYVSKKFGFKRGWSTYRNYIREGLKSDAKHVFGDSLKWLESLGDQRFFLFIQTIDPHVPYQAPAKYMKPYCDNKYRGRFKRFFDGYDTENFTRGKLKLTDREKQRVKCLYNAEIAYHDEYFGRFVSEIRKRGLLENTMIVVSNDHGEELFEHGQLGHGHALWEEVIRTPLVIRFPKLFPAGKRAEVTVGLVDFVPTVLEVLGVERMPDLEGASLLSSVYGKPLPAPGYTIIERLDLQRAVRIGRYKLIESLKGKTLLFDLARDPGEMNNLADSNPIARRACEIYLGEGLAVRTKSRRLSSMGRKRDLTGPQADIDKELEEQLKSLGYTSN